MCVIAASETKLVNKDQIEACFKENPWGAGLAWIDRSGKKPIVRWKKGIATADEVWDIYQQFVKDGDPYVLHFRIPTEGLDDYELNHPFPINLTADATFEGSTPGLVLFHNGGWPTWRPFTLDTCAKFGVRLPKGLLNDSRMMAWNAHFYGEEVLQLINEKALVFGLNEDGSVHFEIYGMEKQNGWNFKGDRATAEGIWFSNDRWEKNLPKPTITNLRDIKRLAAGAGGNRPQATFQPGGESGHGGHSIRGRQPQQEQMEGREGATPAGSESDGKLANSPELILQMSKVHTDADQLAWAMQHNPKKFNRRVAGFIASASPMVH